MKKNKASKIVLAILVMMFFLGSLSGCAAQNDSDKMAEYMLLYTSLNNSNLSQLVNGNPKKRAVYIYLCGSNLESDLGAAVSNINEILQAQNIQDTYVVIETGGSRRWTEYNIPSNKICRFLINNNQLIKIAELENSSMGDEKTMESFLEYCNKNFPAEQKCLILWNHGSSEGICYDSNYSMDCLTYEEMTEALSATKSKFDIIGFDACLMANYDVVKKIGPYANYIIGSQEIAPSSGWDYKSFIQYFQQANNVKELGKSICDSYIEKCKVSAKQDRSELVTLSFLDMSELDAFLNSFENFSQYLFNSSDSMYFNFEVMTALDKSIKLGANSRYEGYSNLIDLKNFSSHFESASAVKLGESIDRLVAYKVCGANRANVGGISLYYPIKYIKAKVDEYLTSCSSVKYKEYLQSIYGNIPGNTMVFENNGYIDDKGRYSIKLSQDSKKYIMDVDFYLLEYEEANKKFRRLCFDNDILIDKENMIYSSNFKGVFVGLDGHRISYNVTEASKENIIFSAPLMVNSQNLSYFKFAFIWDDSYKNGGYYKPLGIWNGITNGLSDRRISDLTPGNEVKIIMATGNMADNNPLKYEITNTFIIGSEGPKINEVPLKGEIYDYIFAVTDIFGRTIYSNVARFKMKYTAEELANNPLEDEEIAADVIEIRQITDSLINKIKD